MRVKLDDVIARITGNVDRFNTDLKYYVGGEHYDYASIAIYNKGYLKSEKGSLLGFKFHFPFKAGDTLFMARNPHLKKAGMVTYDGICSDASYVLRTKDPTVLLPEYLPLIIQNDLFWAFFEANKSGSVNYLMNWKEMRNYEFELPSIERQKVIADMVWAAERTRVSYIKLMEATDELVKSQFIEMFTDKDYPCLQLADLAEAWQKGQPFKKDDIIPNGTRPCIHYGELFTQYGIFIEDIFSKTNSEQVRLSKAGDILFPASDVTPVGLTKCSALLMDGVILGGDIIIMRPIEGNNPVYLSYAIRMEKEQLLSRITGSVVRHISAKSLQSLTIIVPPILKQEQFEAIIRQSDKSKFELQQSIDRIDLLIKALIAQEE